MNDAQEFIALMFLAVIIPFVIAGVSLLFASFWVGSKSGDL